MRWPNVHPFFVASEKGTEWGEFLHLPHQQFFDFDEIREEIRRETSRVTGNNNGISSHPISLKLFSPNVLNLTLVDLPGTTKVPVGDQPADIEQQIREMSRQYIKNPNAIILAVTPANTDLANSDALKLAREVDPEGHRTIGIVTKIDMMDRGTDAVDILQGRVIPLHRGFVGVVNRSQADIKAEISIDEAQRKEMHFFESHPAYRAMQQVGTKYLSQTLNHMLVHHIRQCLPEIKNRIHAMLAELTAEIKSLGSSTDRQNQFDLGGSLLSILSQYRLYNTNSYTIHSYNITSHNIHSYTHHALVIHSYTDHTLTYASHTHTPYTQRQLRGCTGRSSSGRYVGAGIIWWREDLVHLSRDLRQEPARNGSVRR
jgi:hypothetical protein